MKIVISDQIAQAIEILPSAEMRAEFYSVYFAYVTNGAEPTDAVSVEVRALFMLAKPTIDKLNRASIKKRDAANSTVVEPVALQPHISSRPEAGISARASAIPPNASGVLSCNPCAMRRGATG